MHCIFLSLDDSGDGALNAKEFVDVQTVLLTNIWLTLRFTKKYKQTPPMKAIKSFCTNANELFASEGFREQVDQSYFL